MCIHRSLRTIKWMPFLMVRTFITQDCFVPVCLGFKLCVLWELSNIKKCLLIACLPFFIFYGFKKHTNRFLWPIKTNDFIGSHICKFRGKGVNRNYIFNAHTLGRLKLWRMAPEDGMCLCRNLLYVPGRNEFLASRTPIWILAEFTDCKPPILC